MNEHRPGTKLLTVKLYPEERARLAVNAKEAGLSMSAFIRWRCIEAPNGERPTRVEPSEPVYEDVEPAAPIMIEVTAPVAARARILRW